ncbi:MAG: hypothetical protein AMJ45_06320 [Syntrophobacter sp. DG_60]|nr:MAG: hypothetical protein AMJ45_06320 [Syntrophobacter sp. DG_60]
MNGEFKILKREALAHTLVNLFKHLKIDAETLSEISGKSKGFFYQLERDMLVEITYNDLWQIVSGLFLRYSGQIRRSIKDTILSPWDLLRFVLSEAVPDYAPSYIVNRSVWDVASGAERMIEGMRADHQYIDLTSQFINGRMVAVLTRPKVGSEIDLTKPPLLNWHGGEEFAYCLKGSVALFFLPAFGNRPEVILLQEGDSVWFPSTIPHKFEFLSSHPEGNLIFSVYHEPQGTPTIFPPEEEVPKRSRRRFELPMELIMKHQKNLELIKIGALIRVRRETLRWSLDQAAYATGVTKSYFQRIENGTLNPNMEVLHRIMHSLDLTWEELFQGGAIVLTPRELIEKEEVDPVTKKEVLERLTDGTDTNRDLAEYNIRIQAAPCIFERLEHINMGEFLKLRRLCFTTRSKIIPMITEYKEIKEEQTKIFLGIHPGQQAVLILDGGIKAILKEYNGEELALKNKHYPTIHEKEVDINEAHIVNLRKGDFLYFDASRIYHFLVKDPKSPSGRGLVVLWRPYA